MGMADLRRDEEKKDEVNMILSILLATVIFILAVLLLIYCS
jgi:hypothetical protein